MTETLCHNCQDGITADRAGPVYCDCLLGLAAEMLDLSKKLCEAAETLTSMVIAKCNETERKLLQDYCEELKHLHDALEAEWTERRANE